MSPIRLAALAVCALWLTVRADIRFTVSAEQTQLTLNDQLIINARVVSSRALAGLKAPTIPASEFYTVVRTDQDQSQQTSINVVNGRMQQSVSITYQFRSLLTVLKEGTFTFPALTFDHDGTSHSSQPFTVTVTREPVEAQLVSVNVLVGKRKLFVGEQTPLTIQVAVKANAPVNLANEAFMNLINQVDQTFGKSFSISRLFTNQITQSQKQINGEMCKVFELTFSLIPLNPGSLTLPAIPFEYELLKATRRRSNDPFFDDFFGGGFFGQGVQRVAKTTRSNPVTIEAVALPPAPANFSGAVGTGFELLADASPMEVPAGESVTLKISIKGRVRPGNLGDVKLPSIPDFEIFTPERQTMVDTTAAGFVSRKNYKYLLIPRQEGKGTIPLLQWVYFDPAAGTYKTLTAGPINLTVTKGSSARREPTRYLSQEDIRQVGRDIRYIKTPLKIRMHSGDPLRNPLIIFLYPLPFLFALFALLYKYQSRRRLRDQERTRQSRAATVALRGLDRLGRQPAAQASAHAARIADLLLHYLNDRFGFAAAGKTFPELHAELASRGVSEEQVTEMTSLLESVDIMRFAGMSADQNLADLINRTRAIIRQTEKIARTRVAAPSLKTAMQIAVIVAGLLGAHTVHAAPVQVWFEKANSFYEQQQYDSAVAYYDLILENGHCSDVYYNLGNALYRQGRIGLAILNYERAHRLQPNDPDIEANLRFANLNIVDRVPAPEPTFWDAVFGRLHTLFPLQVQVWILLGLISLLSMLFVIGLFASHNLRLWLIYLGVLILLITLLQGISTGLKVYEKQRVHHAIVLESSVDARNEPNGSKILFTAHEGTKFRIRSRANGWSFVSLPNGVSGWVPDNCYGKI